MSARLLVSLLLLAGSALAQLQILSLPAPGVEEPIGTSIDLGSVPTGDLAEKKLRLRNIGAEPVFIQRLRVTGAGFQLDGHPSMPYSVQPGGNLDFRVKFRPNGAGLYSGTLQVDDTYVMLFGSSPATIAVLAEEYGALRLLSSGETVIFGRVDIGGGATLGFRLENPERTELIAEALETYGGEFAITPPVTTPIVLAPGEGFGFSIRFSPAASGIRRSTLVMNDRSFVLEGVGLNPPFPQPQIVFEPQTLDSGQQGQLLVQLPSPSPASGTGLVRMAFEPSDVGTPDDPAIQFVSTGERVVTFSLAEGEQAAKFDGLERAVFQSGTTAGSITFTVELGDHLLEVSVVLAPLPVVVDSSSWRRTATGIDVTVTGFDNTRSATEVAFRFFDAEGRSLTTEPLRAQVADAFRQYYSATQIGGVFSLVAAFPVAGDVSFLGALEVEFRNAAGVSGTHRLSFR